MTELKQTEISFDQDVPIFKLKVTNIRKSAYPTNNPVESDLQKFKIGDYVTKPTGNCIYEVVGIHREPITQSQIEKFNKVVSGYGRIPDVEKVRLLFAEYEKNGNFGACRITVKPLLRGTKQVVKGRLVKFLEVDQIRPYIYNGYQRADLQEMTKNRDYWISRLKIRVDKEQKRLDYQLEMKKALTDLMNPPQQAQIQEEEQAIAA